MLNSRPFRGVPLAPLLLLVVSGCSPVSDRDPDGRSLVLAHFMSPLSSVRADVVVPFAERLAELSEGRLTVTEYMGGALGSSPRGYYSLLLDGVADVVATLPGYTSAVFPMTALSVYPGVCDSAIECTEALQRARPMLEDEYRARVLAIWSATPPVLVTRDRPVRKLEDLQGLKLRVSSRLEMPFVEALGASPVMQPISEVQQNLHNGVIDGVVMTAGGILPYQLQEAAAYVTTWLPLSAAPFVLLMNRDTYASLSSAERSWVDQASDAWLSMSGAWGYEATGARGLRVAREAGVELIDLPDREKARFEDAVAGTLQAQLARRLGDLTVAEVIERYRGR
ncbi:MAG: TRAP transporter substrate-binding protein [Gemmatimonadetes bacterium]|nr:TRAP transporter substrate-binding protein [Gemmatimonadota bacterium]